jgi:hypothetical protein
MKFLFPTFLIVFLISCYHSNNTEWHTLDFGTFTLRTPPGWSKFNEQGIDSYVGGLTNGKDSLRFDYGAYSADLGDGDPSSSHLYARDTINGMLATIQVPKVDGHGVVNMSIPHINNVDRFIIGGHNIPGTATILKIFQSIVFTESDTTKNGHLALNGFTTSFHPSGRRLYFTNCASCHNRTKITVGPPLSHDFCQTRTNEWVYTFLTHRNQLVKDSAWLAHVKEYERKACMEWPELTKGEVDQIWDYLKN